MGGSSLASLPEPPYYAVIFTSLRPAGADEEDDYLEVSRRMAELAKTMPGYLGFEAARGEGGVGIGVSYWESEEAIANWKRQTEHLEAQRRGVSEFYEAFTLRVAKVERQQEWGRGGSVPDLKGRATA